MIVMAAHYKICGHATCRGVLPKRRFYKRTRNGHVTYDSWCKRCRVEASRAAYQVRRNDPVRWARELQRLRDYRNARYKLDPEFRRAEIERHRRYVARVRRRDPALWQRFAQDARIRAKLQRERQGLATRDAQKNWVGIGSRVLLDRQPVLDFVTRAGGIPMAAPDDPGLQRALHRVVSGETAHVELGVVDALVMAHGLLIHDLYDPAEFPELYA